MAELSEVVCMLEEFSGRLGLSEAGEAELLDRLRSIKYTLFTSGSSPETQAHLERIRELLEQAPESPLGVAACKEVSRLLAR